MSVGLMCEALGITHDEVARREVEHREVPTVGVREPLEEFLGVIADEGSHDPLVHRSAEHYSDPRVHARKWSPRRHCFAAVEVSLMTTTTDAIQIGLVPAGGSRTIADLEALPIDSLWVGGHVASRNPSPEVMMGLARLGALTERVKVGSRSCCCRSIRRR